MEKYNIYYRNEKINNRPLSNEDLDKVKSLEYINKYNKVDNSITTIPTKDVDVIKCYVV